MYLTIHLTVLFVTAVFIFLSEREGVRWLRGTTATLDITRLRRYHLAVLIGLLLMVLTGYLMVTGKISRGRIDITALYIKLSFVGLLALNSIVIGRLLKITSVKPYASLTSSERLPIMISGAVSVIGWLGAITTAFFLG